MKNYGELKQAANLPALSSSAEEIAEELVFLVHEGADWDVWGGARLKRYWDALAERVCAATYAGPSLNSWWDDISVRLPATAKSPEHRLRLIELTGKGADKDVLKALRSKGSLLVLRLRVMLETAREQKGNDL